MALVLACCTLFQVRKQNNKLLSLCYYMQLLLVEWLLGGHWLEKPVPSLRNYYYPGSWAGKHGLNFFLCLATARHFTCLIKGSVNYAIQLRMWSQVKQLVLSLVMTPLSCKAFKKKINKTTNRNSFMKYCLCTSYSFKHIFKTYEHPLGPISIRA